MRRGKFDHQEEVRGFLLDLLRFTMHSAGFSGQSMLSLGNGVGTHDKEMCRGEL